MGNSVECAQLFMPGLLSFQVGSNLINPRRLASCPKQVLCSSRVCVALLNNSGEACEHIPLNTGLIPTLWFSYYTKSVISLGTKEILSLVGGVGSS